MLNAARHRFFRLIDMVRQAGVGTTLRRIAMRLSGSHRRYLREKAQEDRQFDDARGVDTGGVQHAFSFEAGDTDVQAAIAHIATRPDAFAAAMAVVDLPHETLTFVDLGSGKGRALLLAADHSFRRIVGVEFAAELHAVASANLGKLGHAIGPGERFELVHGDATLFRLPNDPLLLFLFHPFNPPVLTDVVRNVTQSIRERPRPIRVVYVNPVHLDTWIAAGWRLRQREQRFAILAPPA